MRNSALVFLAMAGIGIARGHPHPGIGGAAVVGPGGGYGAPAIAHGGSAYGAPAAVGHGGGGGHYNGGSVFQSVGAGGLLRGIGNALLGSIVHNPGVQVSHGGYIGGGHAGKLFGAKGIPGGFSAGNPYKGGGPSIAYGLPVPTGHDTSPWRPIKAPPVEVLKKPAHVTTISYAEPISHAAPASYDAPVSYGAPASYVAPASYDAPASYAAPVSNQLYGSYSQQMSITPSMSFGYSYKLVPTYAYGPTVSGGEGSGLGVSYGH